MPYFEAQRKLLSRPETHLASFSVTVTPLRRSASVSQWTPIMSHEFAAQLLYDFCAMLLSIFKGGGLVILSHLSSWSLKDQRPQENLALQPIVPCDPMKRWKIYDSLVRFHSKTGGTLKVIFELLPKVFFGYGFIGFTILMTDFLRYSLSSMQASSTSGCDTLSIFTSVRSNRCSPQATISISSKKKHQARQFCTVSMFVANH